MAEKITKCTSCGKEIAKSAKTCPSCGAKQKKPIYKKVWFWAIIIILLIIIIPSSSGENKSTNKKETNQDKTNATETSAETPQETISYTTVDMKTFLDEYDKNKLAAQEKYTDTYIQTTGYISNISSVFGSTYISINFSRDSFLDNSITCYPKSEEKDKVLKLENKEKITVRGKVQDMSMMSIDLEDCEIV